MKVAILGYGVVGSGVYEVLTKNAEAVAANVGEPLEIKYVLDLREFPGDPVNEVLTHDFRDIVEDPEVQIVAEVMGGREPAYSFVKECLLKGKAVCTSNKEMVSHHAAELLEIARQKKTNFLFEASVGGAIPIIRPMNRSLTAEQILEIKGIVNGTTNYILSQMRDLGMSFETALSEAQANGFAERNPAADIEGIDAARKNSILSSLACGYQVDADAVYTEGITKITADDIAAAKLLNREIKLLSITKRVDDKFYAYVAPHAVAPDCQLYFVNGVYNAIMVNSTASGELMFYGSGAGKIPTAGAVAGDMVDAARNIGRNLPVHWSEKKAVLSPVSDLQHAYMVRVEASELEKVKAAFAVTAETVVNGQAVVITEVMSGADFKAKAAEIDIKNAIRVYEK